MRLTYLLLLSIFSVAAPATFAAQTYISADSALDITSGEWITDPVLIVENGVIVSMNGDIGNATSEDHIVELQGMRLLPGLFDMHVHITSDPSLQGYNRLRPSELRSVLKGASNARDMLLAGVTTIRNLGAGGHGDVALRDAIEDGDVIGPRIFAAGPSLGVTGGHCDNNLLPKRYEDTAAGVADGPWEVTRKVRENIKYGSDVIKFCATGGVMSKGTKVGVQQYTLEEMQAIVTEAHRRGRTVAAHAHGTEGIKAAIEAGVDSVEHASFIDDEGIALAIKNGTYLSMDIYVTEYILGRGAKLGILEESLAKERTVGAQQRKNFQRAVAAGAKMVLGTDAGIFPHDESPKQLSRMVQFGMTPLMAVQAATINAADLLQQKETLGSLTVGKSADIIAVAGNPLDKIELLEDVKFVMKDGVIYKQKGND
ncbi:MAG: amidohydrolase family protein [Halieaceae bacterium]